MLRFQVLEHPRVHRFGLGCRAVRDARLLSQTIPDLVSLGATPVMRAPPLSAVGPLMTVATPIPLRA